jgi:uncharacterized protein YigA (DUF484 family)
MSGATRKPAVPADKVTATKARTKSGAKSGAKSVPKRPPSKESIRAFLADNPHYLTDNPDVLAAVVPAPRHGDKQVTDLQSFLIERLRAENGKLNSRHAELLATIRTNLSSQGLIHKAALSLLEARSFHDMIEVTTTVLAVKLNVDVVTLAVENEGNISKHTVAGITLLTPGSVDALMGEDRDVVLNAGIEGRKALYGAGAGLVASEALLRLHASPEAPRGILALASRDASRFDPTQGTELLSFLARVLELCIRTWLGLPRS